MQMHTPLLNSCIYLISLCNYMLFVLIYHIKHINPHIKTPKKKTNYEFVTDVRGAL